MTTPPDLLHERIGPWAVTRWPEIRHHLVKSTVDPAILDAIQGEGNVLIFSNGMFSAAVCETPGQVAMLKDLGGVNILQRGALEHVLHILGHDPADLARRRLYDLLVLVLRQSK